MNPTLILKTLIWKIFWHNWTAILDKWRSTIFGNCWLCPPSVSEYKKVDKTSTWKSLSVLWVSYPIFYFEFVWYVRNKVLLKTLIKSWQCRCFSFSGFQRSVTTANIFCTRYTFQLGVPLYQTQSEFFLWSLLPPNLNIEVESLWSHLEWRRFHFRFRSNKIEP